jgi:hypothetical protein
VTGYVVQRVAGDVDLSQAFGGGCWADAASARVGCFRPESSDHRPDVEVRLVHDGGSICGVFNVKDRYVRSVSRRPQEGVCSDSCVEFFFEPRPGLGYFNFEFNCGGNLLCSFVRDWRRTQEGVADYSMLSLEDARAVEVYHTMPEVVEPEIVTAVTWRVGFRIPVSMLERYAGTSGALSGQQWRANFYKCGDRTSHPHWASWAPVPELNFHAPEAFAPLVFA